MATAPVAPNSQAIPSIIYDQLPDGCFAFQVQGHASEPLVHRGEFAVIDTSDCEPVIGSLVLRRFSGRSHLAIVEVVASPFRPVATEPQDERTIMLASYCRPRTIEAMSACLETGRPVGFADGPYQVEGAHSWYLESIIVGKVIGVLAGDGHPAFCADSSAKPIDPRPSPFTHPELFALVPL